MKRKINTTALTLTLVSSGVNAAMVLSALFQNGNMTFAVEMKLAIPEKPATTFVRYELPGICQRKHPPRSHGDTEKTRNLFFKFAFFRVDSRPNQVLLLPLVLILRTGSPDHGDHPIFNVLLEV